MGIEEAKQVVCDAGRKLVKEGLVSRTWGNISSRVDGDFFVITPSGRTYESLVPDDIVLVSIKDLKHRGQIKPSSEKGLHAEVYKMRGDVTAVIHTHQMNASTVAAARKEIPQLQREMAAVLGESVRCAAYALPGTKKLKFAAAKALEGRNAALLANHGAVCIGTNMDQAFDVAKTLEDACRHYIERAYLNQVEGITCFDEDHMHRHYLETHAGR